MPCRGPETDYSRVAADLRNDIDALTALLCEACATLKARDDLLPYSRLSIWYNKHEKEDIKRIKEEVAAVKAEHKRHADRKKMAKMKEKLLSKLSNEEKKALGL